jgi:hypothetical protein
MVVLDEDRRKKMKTSELTGRALDWAVTRANYEINFEFVWRNCRVDCNYSSDWRQGGPIIERERITIDAREHGTLWVAHSRQVGQDGITGPTPLIAAMRCYVANKLGDEVEIPQGIGM